MNKNKELCNKFPLEKGLFYTKDGVKVKKPDFRKSHVEVNGEQYLFISIKNGKYLNELHSDGLVYEPKTSKELIPYSPKNSTMHKGRHIMVRYLSNPKPLFEYIGDELYDTRYDFKRNKLYTA